MLSNKMKQFKDKMDHLLITVGLVLDDHDSTIKLPKHYRTVEKKKHRKWIEHLASSYERKNRVEFKHKSDSTFCTINSNRRPLCQTEKWGIYATYTSNFSQREHACSKSSGEINAA